VKFSMLDRSRTRSRWSSRPPTRSGSPNIFNTAITRARRRLGVFWTAETHQRILSRLAVRENTKDREPAEDTAVPCR